ncbi:hypothetical protein EDC01DRAFT_708022 [Geopyxis carbonaria]|nr:hypothetical protein EDC01DRAFT_708022 [Geopyxis carbonaria]
MSDTEQLEDLPQSPAGHEGDLAMADDTLATDDFPAVAGGIDDDSDNDSVLSDLDDEAFADYNENDIGKEVIPIDSDTVGAIGKFKRKVDASAPIARPSKEKRRRRGERRHRDDDDPIIAEPIVELTAEERRRIQIEKTMDDAVKGPKKKKKRKNDHDLEKMDDEKVENIRYSMIEAAERDADCIEAGQPAVNKLAMLEEVRQIIGRQNLLNVALDGQILTGVRRWLEPLPNRSLPAYNVQKLMFEILARLKPDIEHLRESGIGKIVMFYTKDSRPELHIKRQAEKLVRDWSRPILGRSDDYHSRDVPISNGANGGFARQRPRRNSMDERPAGPVDPNAVGPRTSGRARVPMPSSQSYDVAPQSRVASGYNQFARPVGAAGDDFIRKMKAKKAAKLR